jgi:type I restriction enzyme, S subunit
MNGRSYQLDTHDSSILPKSWVWTTLGEIGTVASGGTPSTKEPSNFDGEIPWVTPADLTGYTKKFIGKGRRNLTKRGLDHSSAALLPAGAVLFSSRAPVGYVAIASNPLATNQGFKNLILQDWISPDYVYYYLMASKQLAESFASGTTFLEVSGSRFARIPIPLCPRPEQCRIVAKVEELFTKLDAGVKSLQTVKVQLKRFRQSVLKSAFDGKVTEEWRRTHRDELEPASMLLERIKEEQRKTVPKKYETPPLDTTNLSELPKGWAWTRVGEVATRIQYGSSEKATEDPSGVPVLRMGNIQEGNLVLEDLKYYSKDCQQLNDFMLDPGDVLFNRTNSAELVGKTAVYEHWHPKAAFASYLIRVKVNDRIYDPQILAFFINSYYGRRYVASVVSQQVGQANVNGKKLSAMPIPLTSLSEQKAIAEEIKRCFSITEEVEKTVVNGLRQAEKLRQSILKCAFEGKLIPQDPSDEPASVLLERIKSLKTQMIQGQKAKKGRQDEPKQRRLM